METIFCFSFVPENVSDDAEIKFYVSWEESRREKGLENVSNL